MQKHIQDRQLKCHLCDKSFISKGDLKSHMPQHTETKEFTCNICQKTFTRMHTLTNHMEIHCETRNFQCKLCPTKSKYPIQKSHMSQHYGEKLLNCSICGKFVKGHNGLKNHRRTVHKKEEHFSCTQCPKIFTCKKSASLHTVSCHTKEGLGLIAILNCDICGKSCSTATNMTTHMALQHTDEAKKHFECMTCLKKIS